MEITVFMDISINPGPIRHKIPFRTTVNRQFRKQVGVASLITVNKLLQKNCDRQYPKKHNIESLANLFADYFATNI